MCDRPWNIESIDKAHRHVCSLSIRGALHVLTSGLHLHSSRIHTHVPVIWQTIFRMSASARTTDLPLPPLCSSLHHLFNSTYYSTVYYCMGRALISLHFTLILSLCTYIWLLITRAGSTCVSVMWGHCIPACCVRPFLTVYICRSHLRSCSMSRAGS